MSSTRTSLVGGPRLTPEEARAQSFPVVFRGYDRKSVQEFLVRASAELGTLDKALADRRVNEDELVKEVKRLETEIRKRAADSASLAAPVPPAQDSVRVLVQAQRNADQMTADAQQQASQVMSMARNQAEQMVEHARQQAGQLLAQAQAQAEQERARIIGAASGDAQRKVEFLLRLAGTIQGELRGSIDKLLIQLGDWESRVADGAPEPVPA